MAAPEFHAEAFGVAGDSKQCLGGEAKQNVVDNGFVVESEEGDGFRDGEHDLEVFHGQQLGLPLFKPVRARQPLALGAMAIAVRAILNVTILTVVAPFDNTAQRGGAAVLDSRYQSLLWRKR